MMIADSTEPFWRAAEEVGALLLGWPDYLCLLVIAWGALTGAICGFVRVVMNLVSLAAGLVAGAWGTGPVVAWLGRLGLVSAVSARIAAHLPLAQAVSATPVGGRVPIAWGESLPPGLKQALQQRVEALFAGTSGFVTLGELIARAATELFFSVAVFLVILAAVQGLLRWAGRRISWWLGARGLHWPDRLVGAVAGAARNALVVAALAALALPLVTLLPAGQGLLRPGGLAYALAGWFGGIYPWLLAHLS